MKNDLLDSNIHSKFEYLKFVFPLQSRT